MQSTTQKYWSRRPETPMMMRVARNIQVRASEVAGKGAFCRIPLAPSDGPLGWYKGEVITTREYDRRYGGDRSPEYVLMTSRGTLVDACDPQQSNWVRFVNSSYKTGKRANVEFDGLGRLKACRVISPGTELLANYGPDYWRK